MNSVFTSALVAVAVSAIAASIYNVVEKKRDRVTMNGTLISTTLDGEQVFCQRILHPDAGRGFLCVVP